MIFDTQEQFCKTVAAQMPDTLQQVLTGKDFPVPTELAGKVVHDDIEYRLLMIETRLAAIEAMLWPNGGIINEYSR